MCDDWTPMEFHPLCTKEKKIPAVYFLCYAGMDGFVDDAIELVYIGQTKNLYNRIRSHDATLNNHLYLGNKFIGDIVFDSYFFIPTGSSTDLRLYLESRYIKMYQPKLNYVEGWI